MLNKYNRIFKEMNYKCFDIKDKLQLYDLFDINKNGEKEYRDGNLGILFI